MVTTIGICVKKPESMFSNGCFQQSLFIWKALNNISNVKCCFVTLEPDYQKFDDLIPHPVICLNESTVKEFDIIGMLSLTLSDTREFDLNILRAIRQNSVKLVDILCGNLFVLLQEEFVFDVHNIMRNYRNDYIDEVWVLEMYEYSVEYLSLVYKKPVKVLPYVWDHDIIKSYMQDTLHFSFDPNIDNTKINICIYEANMSLHKNAFIPLLIADKYYQKYGDKLNKVYIFCKNKLHDNGFYNRLDVIKAGKVETHGRLVMPFSLKLIEEQTKCKSVVLSYTHLNDLNFLHLELIYLRLPIVHNCPPFKDNKLFYDSSNLMKAVDLLENARTDVVNLEGCINILTNFCSKNKKIQDVWNENIMRLERSVKKLRWVD